VATLRQAQDGLSDLAKVQDLKLETSTAVETTRTEFNRDKGDRPTNWQQSDWATKRICDIYSFFEF
jgi:hypothetical protein